MDTPFHRYSADEIASGYASIADAFIAGDYLLVCERAEDGSELLGCALIMAGFASDGIAALARCGPLSPVGSVCLAFGYWRLGRNDDACAHLARILVEDSAFQLAHDLQAMVKRGRINVLAVAVTQPIFTERAADSEAARRRFGQFSFRHVGTQLAQNDLAYELGDSFVALIKSLPESEQPDMIYSGSPQWFVPPDLAEVKVPKVIWLHDTDRFYYRMPDNYRAFDFPTFSVSQEHHEIRLAAGVEGASNLLCDSLSSPASRAVDMQIDKEFDIVFTGAAFQTPQTDRGRILRELAGLGDRYSIRIVDGHLAERDYLDLIGRAKFVPIINRYLGCPSPRWRDALAQGTFTLYPAGSGYGRFAPGCFPFRPHAMSEDIAAHIERWNVDLPGSPYNLREQWPLMQHALAPMQTSHEAIFEATLKFAMFAPMLRRHFARPAPPKPKRTNWVWPVPGIDAGIFGADVVMEKVTRLANKLQPMILHEDAIGANAIAQLDMQLALLARQHAQHEEGAHYARAINTLDAALAQFPRSLLLNWNRAHWPLFFVNDLERALAGFEAILAHFDTLDFEPAGSDIGFGFSTRGRDPVFWEYAYGNLVLLHTTGKLAAGTLAAFLRSTAFGYLGLVAERGGDAATARAHYAAGLNLFPLETIQELLLTNLLSTVEQREGITPDDPLAVQLRATFRNVSVSTPRLLLQVTPRLLGSASDAFLPADLRACLADWYSLRRCIADSANVRHFPQTEADADMLISRRDCWPSSLDEAVSASDARKRGACTVASLVASRMMSAAVRPDNRPITS